MTFDLNSSSSRPTPSISVIIPSGDSSRGGNLQLLLRDLEEQTVRADEVHVVTGVAPNGHARNMGVKRTTGDYLVFLDDDVRLGSQDILEKLTSHLVADTKLGIVGTSQLLPPDSTSFQRRCASQVSRSQSDVVSVLTPSDMVTTQCCAMRRMVLDEVGGFNPDIIRGVDPELRHRVRKAGYVVAVVPDAWHYHPMPEDLRALLKMAFRNGAASAYARKHYPETVLLNPEGHVDHFDARCSFPRRVVRSASAFIKETVTGHWYGAAYRAAYAWGNIRGTNQ